jgi:hypothetical protein
MEYFNKQPRLGILSTASKEGKVTSALFGSPRMIDEKTVLMGLRKNRTFANLQEPPYAVFMIMEPGASAPEWKGVRVYLKMVAFETEGEKINQVRAQIASMGREDIAKMMVAAATFTVEEIRPVADMGQGWEKSI